MNESIPEIMPMAPAPLPAKDRSTGLIIFGVLTILLGCLAGLFAFLMLFGLAKAATATDPPTNFAAMLPGIGVYGVLAVALVWLGIGSLQARRWARALLLIFSWSWLAMGVFMTIAMAFIMPKVMANLSVSGTPDANHPLPPVALGIAMVFMFVFLGIFFVLMPAAWTFFYNSWHVKATCESRDPVTRWTDACPLPVLGLCLWLWFSVPMMLLMPMVGHGVMPFFGMFLSGAAGSLFCVAIAALWAYAAWLLYHLKPQGWWLILIAWLVIIASSLLTFARHDILEMYHLMGYPQTQIDQIQKTGLLEGNRVSWLTGLSSLPILIYLLFVKKYFRGR